MCFTSTNANSTALQRPVNCAVVSVGLWLTNSIISPTSFATDWHQHLFYYIRPLHEPARRLSHIWTLLQQPKSLTSFDCCQGGYIFYAGASLAGAGYCRQCRRRPAILPLKLRQGCQVCVKISAQRLPRVAQFNAC